MWSIEIALSTKRKLGFIKGIVLRSLDDPMLQEQWDTCNNMVISWFMISVSEPISRSILFVETTQAIWNQLETMFALSNDALNTKKEEYRFFQFLNGLDENFASKSSQLLLMSLLPIADHCFVQVNGVIWILYTGCTDHMTHVTNDFLDLRFMDCQQLINLPNGHTSTISQTGNLKLQNNLFLKDVLVVPFFKFSLLSVLKLTKDSNCFVTIYSQFCVIQDLVTRRVLGLGNKKAG
ncbi:hypothetical protein CTI12_AA035740 [Artemisia annua]|uniref:Retrovirus-related Pol polyprotein from transposon TNT 1-94-like beta-barrel domain-containing protein n=1 Tax=Artemisia annua TaxID=35608 RepID=A0A2U1PNS9_ARTAN|nr:hypothetical protein CTI12_AA035740 [Artemisia annua]